MTSKQLFYVSSFSKDFFVIELEAQSQTLTLVDTVASYPCPSFMEIAEKVLYVGFENGKGTGGIGAYSIEDPCAPRLRSFSPSQTAGPAHIGYMAQKGNAYIISAGYFDGYVQAWPVDAQGQIGAPSCTIVHEGSGPFLSPLGSRQDRARAHCAQPVPGTDLFLCADLGTDTVHAYRLVDGHIEELNRRKMRHGSGPRHVCVHPNGKLFYLVDELDSAISVMTLDTATGEMDVLQRVSALPDFCTDVSWAAAIRLSPDGRFLYASNRGYDSIAVFRLCDAGKRLESVGWLTEGLSLPRDFCFDKTGDFLIATNMKTSTLTLCRVDRETGMPRYVSELGGITRAGCITPFV